MSISPRLTSNHPATSRRQLVLMFVYVIGVLLVLLTIWSMDRGNITNAFNLSTTLISQDGTERTISQMPFRYRSPPAAGINQTEGILFTPDHDVIHRMGLPPQSYVTLTRENVRDFVFVTAADDSHLVESLDAIASVQQYFRGYQIYYYDLGLSARHVTKLRSLCDVHHHVLDLSAYPLHVSAPGLRWKCCWKFVIIQDALRRHGAVFWIDASFRATKNITEWSEIFSLALSTGGVVFGSIEIPPFTNLAYTDPRMYDYIPTDKARQRRTYMAQAGALLVYNTRQTFDNILWWMYLCALQADCCAAIRPHNISHPTDATLDHYPEHRHDQSAFNLLLSNYFGYDTRKYMPQISRSEFYRRPRHYDPVKSRSTHKWSLCEHSTDS